MRENGKIPRLHPLRKLSKIRVRARLIRFVPKAKEQIPVVKIIMLAEHQIVYLTQQGFVHVVVTRKIFHFQPRINIYPLPEQSLRRVELRQIFLFQFIEIHIRTIRQRGLREMVGYAQRFQPVPDGDFYVIGNGAVGMPA